MVGTNWNRWGNGGYASAPRDQTVSLPFYWLFLCFPFYRHCIYYRRKSRKYYYSRDEFCVVREQSGREEVKCQLERALEKEYRLVIVDPPWLGDQAIRY